MARRTILVANPTARSGKAEALIARALDHLAAAGLPAELVATLPDGGTIGEVRRAIAAGARCVVALGGDGTFAEVAKGILASDHAAEVDLGLLPMGTANDQGKSFGLRTGEAALAENARVVADGRLVHMDVGRVERLDEADRVVGADLFFDSMSIGLGAAVLAERNRDRERIAEIPFVRALYRDRLVYAGALLKRLGALAGGGTGFALEAVIDGVTFTYANVIDAIVKNTRVYGGEWVLAPDAEADDGLFELVPVCGVGDFAHRMVTALPGSPIDDADLGKLGLELEQPRPGRELVLTVLQPGAAVPPPAQIDGEELPAGDRFRITVLARILRLRVPRT